MKVYLDDERPTPSGWVRAYWPDDAIEFLLTGMVEVISLDHDLGDDSRGTGYDVIRWIEEQVVFNSFRPPVIWVHSANPSAHERMIQGLRSIKKLSCVSPADTGRAQ